jgi:hypothetical protein
MSCRYDEYKKANDYYRESILSDIKDIQYSVYKGPDITEQFEHTPVKSKPRIRSNSELENNFQQNKGEENKINMKMENTTLTTTSDPTVWGPSFWFMLHNGASKYPIEASNHRKERMKGFILGIPTMVPCEGCISHAIPYLEASKSKLDTIVKGRDSLFKFFVDFHNNVNKRLHKREYTYDEAYQMYQKGVTVKRTVFV